MHGLLRSKAEKTVPDKAAVKQVQHPVLQIPFEIDQNVPANNEVHFAKNFIYSQVMIGKRYLASQ
jgi:hypothetical protein